MSSESRTLQPLGDAGSQFACPIAQTRSRSVRLSVLVTCSPHGEMVRRQTPSSSGAPGRRGVTDFGRVQRVVGNG